MMKNESLLSKFLSLRNEVSGLHKEQDRLRKEINIIEDRFDEVLEELYCLENDDEEKQDNEIDMPDILKELFDAMSEGRAIYPILKRASEL